jgi:predicted hotdog family 3-hydroxylacyl-ACP dehydratase
MKPEEYNILDLIPQRQPMVLIDQLISVGENSASGRLFIRESNVFCAGGYFQEGGLMEFIAQTAAAWKGYRQLSQQEGVNPGFIGAIKNLSVHLLPEINTEIQSEILVDSELLGYTLITGKVVQNKTIVAECEMRIFIGTTGNK